MCEQSGTSARSRLSKRTTRSNSGGGLIPESWGPVYRGFANKGFAPPPFCKSKGWPNWARPYAPRTPKRLRICAADALGGCREVTTEAARAKSTTPPNRGQPGLPPATPRCQNRRPHKRLARRLNRAAARPATYPARSAARAAARQDPPSAPLRNRRSPRSAARPAARRPRGDKSSPALAPPRFSAMARALGLQCP